MSLNSRSGAFSEGTFVAACPFFIYLTDIMILNSFDKAIKIYIYARKKLESIREAQADDIYREVIGILDVLISQLNYSTHMVKYGEIPGDLNGLTVVLDAASWLREEVWHKFLTVGSGDYKGDYLTSRAWADKRWQVMWRDGFMCPCGARATEVHHKHYKNIGREQLEDLVALCNACHNKL